MMTRRVGLSQQQQEQPLTSHSSNNSSNSSNNSNNNNSNKEVIHQQQQQKSSTTRHRRNKQQQYPFPSRSVSTFCMILGAASLFMGLFTLFAQKNNNNSNTGLNTSHNSNPSVPADTMRNMMPLNSSLKESRLRAALWGFFAGDALAMPSHWYYGGPAQIQRDYGSNKRGGSAGITDYTKPVYHLAGSILNKSNLSGGGRSTSASSRRTQNEDGTPLPPSIIGYVINHGKQDLWSPNEQIHYHATLAKGENTLEVQLARVLMRSMVATAGIFNKDHFLKSYVDFMTTPDSHHDTYASTCHRMFFANKIFQGRADVDCPDNDGHNVDTIDGLVLPTITALAVAARGSSGSTADNADSNDTLDDLMQRAAQAAMATASVTRRSNILENAAAAWSRTVVAALLAPVESEVDSNMDSVHMNMEATLQDTARAIGMRRAPSNQQVADQMTACYLDSAMPALLDSVAKYIPDDNNGSSKKKTTVWNALLNNANAGGENVHRGSCLGAVLGARAGMEGLAGTPELVEGLHDREALAQEIDDFVAAVMKA
jgi:ADP-ribosyl-[dinitrogen reductase] hydrolase